MRANRSASQESSESNNSEARSRLRSTPPASEHDMSMLTDYLVKVEELSAFDACVETSDALAASSPYTTSSAKYDKETGLTDCSVLVSPDGDLLLLPNEQDGSVSSRDEAAQGGESEDKDPGPEQNDQEQAPPAMLSDARFCTGGEFESAVFMGNDLRTGGDKAVNGFSAMGWSPSAASLAIRQSEDAIRSTAAFVEDIMLIRKEGAARASQACDKLRTNGSTYPLEHRNGMAADFELLADGDGAFSWRSNTSINNGRGLETIANRVGPLRFSGGTINAATQALEQYHSTMAENDANRWRMASLSNLTLDNETSNSRNVSVGVLPALRRAGDQAADRSYNREKALREMQRRADAIDARLAQCKEISKQRWDAVHDAEEAVTRIVEERMLERSRERERLRMEQLRETFTDQDENPQLGATPNEIWDLVSAVAESMEGGSFEPTGLPQASIGGPQDKSLRNYPTGSQDGDTAEAGLPGSNDLDPATPFPLASRADVEEECNLPALRAAAMAADDAIEDSAGSLLNVLSTLDTTRRSARVAAETCLLSVAHAQAKSIRSLIALERASIEDRLQNIKELERIADNMDVRADLNAYITADKKERGGSTWFGEDDDGGVASALAVLSSHVEGSMGYTTSSKVLTEGWDQSDYDEEFSAEKMEDAVEHLFDRKALDGDNMDKGKNAEEEYEKSVQMLCKVASDHDSMQSRSLRSTICYAINQKRSSHVELQDAIHFDSLCRVFSAILTGCDREASGVSNAKMCMMLSQTFYMVEKKDTEAKENPVASPVRIERNERIFVKSRLMDHPLWSDEEFW